MSAPLEQRAKSNRRKNRKGRRSHEHPVLRWLGAGAVVAGMGVAVNTGQAVAYADEAPSESTSTESS